MLGPTHHHGTSTEGTTAVARTSQAPGPEANETSIEQWLWTLDGFSADVVSLSSDSEVCVCALDCVILMRAERCIWICLAWTSAVGGGTHLAPDGTAPYEAVEYCNHNE